MSQISSRLVPAMRRQVCLACSQLSAGAPVASTSRSSSRSFTSSSKASAKLTEDKLGKNDPLDLVNLEQFRFDDIPWVGHLTLEKDREKLHLLRLIEFQFPEIEKLRVPYKAPPKEDMIKLRTVYQLGEPDHPGSRKAVITFSISDLINHGSEPLASKKVQHKFKLLAGQRWNPQDDSVKISCDDFPTFHMNSKWCSDVLDKLIAEAQNMEDPMSDIPLDTRHADARNSKKSRRKASLKDIPKAWLNLPPVEQQD